MSVPLLHLHWLGTWKTKGGLRAAFQTAGAHRSYLKAAFSRRRVGFSEEGVRRTGRSWNLWTADVAAAKFLQFCLTVYLGQRVCFGGASVLSTLTAGLHQPTIRAGTNPRSSLVLFQVASAIHAFCHSFLAIFQVAVGMSTEAGLFVPALTGSGPKTTTPRPRTQRVTVFIWPWVLGVHFAYT